MRSGKGKTRILSAMLTAALALTLLAGLVSSGTTVVAQPAAPAEIGTNWHTFLGSVPVSPGDSDDDVGYGVAVDSAGYAYVVGQSINGEWDSTPIVTHSLGLDGFLARLDGAGTLLWHTFIGGSEADSARAITMDDADHLFVLGTSNGGNWDTEPISASHGFEDIFVARFDLNGARQWFTFVGTEASEYGRAIAVDEAGNICVGGVQVVNPYLARLDGAGAFRWQRAITSTAGDLGDSYGIAVDQSGDVYLTGYADYGDWYGAPPPVRPHSGYPGQSDAFVAKFDGEDGTLLWHTFLGAADSEDAGYAIAVRTGTPTSTVYVAGRSADGWGSPIHPHSGGTDGFVAQLNGADGTLAWNTFMGGGNDSDEIRTIAFSHEGHLLVAGASGSGWGHPVIPHPGGGVGDAAFVAALSAKGDFRGNTFLGGASSSDTAYGLTVDDQGGIYVAGTSWSPDSVGWNNPAWGAPIRGFSGTHDGFVARLGVRSVVRYWIYAPLILKNDQSAGGSR